MKRRLLSFLLAAMIFTFAGCALPNGEDSASSETKDNLGDVSKTLSSEASSEAVPDKNSKDESQKGFKLDYDGDRVVYTDYDLHYRVVFPKYERFTYNFEYDEPGLNEGAPYGRTTMTVYIAEDGQPFDRNKIELKSSLAGTREEYDFLDLATTKIIYFEGTDKYYYLNETEDGVELLYENKADMHCVKMNLTYSLYEELESVLSEIMLSSEWYGGE